MTKPAGLFKHVSNDWPDCLRDESRLTGSAESIAFPETEQALAEHLAYAARHGRGTTVQGARTGIAGGAVPQGGHIINLSRMNRVLGMREVKGAFLLRVQPGLLLADVRTMLAQRRVPVDTPDEATRQALDALPSAPRQCFAPDPTETSASLGGMAAANASGARSFFYGPTRGHIEGLRMVLADGTMASVRRSGPRAQGRTFAFKTESGRTIRGMLPTLARPKSKNAAGYFVEESMALMDLFIGSEGTLGVIAELELRLLPAPLACWGALMFLPSEEAALAAVTQVRARQGTDRNSGAPSFDPTRLAARAHGALVAMEYFDAHALALLRRHKQDNPSAASAIPDIPDAWHTGLYLEWHADSEDAAEGALMEAVAIIVACGGDENAAWLASTEHEMERLKAFRHALPEAVNMNIDRRRQTDPNIAKLGTDLAVPDSELEHVFALYRSGLARAGLDFVKFGHIGDNHIHVNILPANVEQYTAGRALYLEWARAVVAMGGSVSAEHGIGKLKTDLLAEMVGPAGLTAMKDIKHLFDPGNHLNPGTML